jgi:thiamine pyrophosphate-dependent acetolactate synthase large subunit-like protein
VARVEGSALGAQAMQREGIEVLFGLAGGPIQDIMGWAPHCGVRPIGVRHEQAATFAAAAYTYCIPSNDSARVLSCQELSG